MNFLTNEDGLAWAGHTVTTAASADLISAAALFAITPAIAQLLRQRRDPLFNGLVWLFGAFIIACAVSHAIQAWTLWRADDGAQTPAKVAMAVVSLVTVLAMWRLLPRLKADDGRRRTTEDSLADSEQNLAAALASFGAALIATDREGRVIHMNAVAERMTGWPEDAARDQLLSAVLVRDDRPPHHQGQNPVDVLLSAPISMRDARQTRVIARNGDASTVELREDLTRACDGTVRGLVVIFRDISRLLRAEAEARRLAAIVESSNDAIIGHDLEGVINSWNDGAQAMFGHSAEEAIGRSISLLIPEAVKDEETRTRARLLQGERIPTFNTVRLAKNGALLDVSVTISPIRNAQGITVGASRIARDVTQKRQAEAALRSSAERQRFAMEAARVGEWELDMVTGVIRHSALAAACLGIDPAAEWTLASFLEAIHPDDRGAVENRLDADILVSNVWNVECRIVWPDGSVHWIASHGSVLAEDSVSRLMRGVVFDITAQRHAAESRAEADRLESENRQILEAGRLKNQFLANMSHELRTPLSSIIGFAELLHSGAVPGDSPKHSEFLGYIAASGHHLLRLINDILDISKVEAGAFEFSPEPLRLTAMIDEVLEILHPVIAQKQLSISCEIDAVVDHVALDRSRLKQVLYNFVSNAIKFSHQGGRVAIRGMSHGSGRFCVEVEDNGIGIAESDLPKLFDEFRQLDAALGRREGGAGLGLALTRRLVEAQGGSVGVRSVHGRGTSFHFILSRRQGFQS